MKKYQQLTLEQRYQISAFKQAGFSNSAIAQKLGIDKSTIGRELRRNRSKRGYRPQMAHRKALLRRQQKVCPRISEQTWREVESAVSQQWSPEQISGRRALENKPAVSHEWIYQHLYQDKRMGGALYLNLRCQKKCRKRYGSYSKRGVWQNQTRIDERPPEANQRTRLGDWELDTIIGGGHRQAMVTMVDRQSKLTRIRRVKRKTAKAVARAVRAGLHGLTVHTLTSDNGREFAAHEQIAESLNAGFYFCHPYHSWERGLNENTNGLIRQYFPKQTEFAKITWVQVQRVEDKLNNRPRKRLGYQTPNEIYFKEQEQQKVALTT